MVSEIGKRDQNSAVVLMGITDDVNQDIRMLRVNPTTGRLLISASGGTGFTLLPATGAVNGTNVTFTFTQKPTYIISDGAWYRENVGWTFAGLTATMIIPPSDDIWGFV